ncbi:glucans biosynthesis glucosyltransferase MdoH [Streptomyces ochraceiscleroticus]|uniref:Glucans biosynthesis glucosyltransferase H n=1 Tax=Streptomyces ochraceiscleroticus TaxID=47761 RepID=A0ABW1MKX8_9ACTN|nr:glucans biosynthesis glucosyltransferase MdoH [Streptomyces ochraceiscleroticus]
MSLGIPLVLAALLAGYGALLTDAGIAGAPLLLCTGLASIPALLLATGLFTWSFGIVARRSRHTPAGLRQPPEGTRPGPAARTALVCPIKNEDTAQVFANLQAIHESLRATGADRLFDVFVVSNSDDPDCWVEEELAWARLRRSVPRSHLWRRHRETGRKTANIAEFCERWGSAYRYVVVLDADSLMSGECLLELVRLMEHNPRAGLLQASSRLVNGRTLFARLQQFSTYGCADVPQWGERLWQGSAGTYYGHNAIIRVAPFMAHCGLPRLSGRSPWGGEILSHDFVEGSLLARAGWDVYVVPEAAGSYEECPATLHDHARRDHRWYQGDLLNLRLLRTPALPLAARARFLLAAVRNLGAPAVVLLIGCVLGFADPEGRSACAAAPTSAGGCLGGTGIKVLLAVTLPFVVWDLAGRTAWAGTPAVAPGLRTVAKAAEGSRRFGAAALADGLLDLLLWLATAPARLMSRAAFTLQFVCGRDAGWAGARRAARRPRLTARTSGYLRHSLAALCVSAVCWLYAPWTMWWAGPLLLLWLGTFASALVLDSPRAGSLSRRMGLLRTPEEVDVPPVVARAEQLRHGYRRALPQGNGGWQTALTDPATAALHRGFVAHLPPLTPELRAAAERAAHAYERGLLLTGAQAMALLHAPRPAVGTARTAITFPQARHRPMPAQRL